MPTGWWEAERAAGVNTRVVSLVGAEDANGRVVGAAGVNMGVVMGGCR
jgi:hypothetical protein